MSGRQWKILEADKNSEANTVSSRLFVQTQVLFASFSCAFSPWVGLGRLTELSMLVGRVADTMKAAGLHCDVEISRGCRRSS